MPYFITDKNPDCAGWATIKEDGEVLGCHTDKQSAVDQMVALSLAEDIPVGGERALGDNIVISDIDDTLIVNGELNRAVYDYLTGVDAELYLVTGRNASTRNDTEAQLASLGVEYEELLMNPGGDSNAFKAETAMELVSEYNVLFAIENNPDARKGYEDAGIKTLNPDEIRAEAPVESKWLKAAWAIKNKLEGAPEARAVNGVETRSQHIELRAMGDGKTFEGYAAVFNSPSEPLPFTEIIKPGAFTRSLKSRNRMMLLWNHDASNPLASTRNGSLQLSEDARGLKVRATLPETTLGKDIAVMIDSGLIDAMSFGFRVKKDSWSNDGATRYLEEVSIFEASLVSFPAYEGTAGTTAVRSINPDELAGALLEMESGNNLSADQANLIRDVVAKLEQDGPVNPLDLLDIKQKQLDLLAKDL